MTHYSSIDTDDILFSLITSAIREGAVTINGIVCPQDDRPDTSTTEDIVINTIALTVEKPQDGTSNINIYVPDKRAMVRGKEQNTANRARLKQIGDDILRYIEQVNIPELEIWTESDTIINEPSAGQHYRNIRIKWSIH